MSPTHKLSVELIASVYKYTQAKYPDSAECRGIIESTYFSNIVEEMCGIDSRTGALDAYITDKIQYFNKLTVVAEKL